LNLAVHGGNPGILSETRGMGGCSGKGMRTRLLALLAVALCVALAWVAAPALSLRPYMPAAVDFEQRLPAAMRMAGPIPDDHARAAAAEPGWISPVVEAPHEFDLVGIAKEMRAVQIRARDQGGEWSEWVESAAGDPVYFGGADELQVRADFRPAGTLHYVNVSGTAGGAADRALNEVRGAINSAVISVASLPVAEALAPRPRFVTREEWGANRAEGGCPPRTAPAYGSVKAGVIHHTVTANEYSLEEANGIVLGICRYHRNANGWNDIGYQALVDRFGRVYKGRAGGMKKPVVGAQAQGFNSQTTGVSSIGEHDSAAPTAKASAAIVRYLAWKLNRHGVNPVTKKTKLVSAGGEATPYPAGTVVTPYRVIGHRRLNSTACPGALLYAQVASLRNRIQKRIKKYAGR
jgi:hypothetical protein